MSHQPQNGRLTKHDKRTSTQSTTKAVDIPDELEKVLAVLSGGILEGHIKLAAALKKRYDNQYPLVRSLADVFTAHVRTAVHSAPRGHKLTFPSHTYCANTLLTYFTWSELWPLLTKACPSSHLTLPAIPPNVNLSV
jgi:hypothetical protein